MIERTQIELATVSEAADALRVTEWAIRDMIHQGRIPYVRVGRKFLIPLGEIVGGARHEPQAPTPAGVEATSDGE